MYAIFLKLPNYMFHLDLVYTYIRLSKNILINFVNHVKSPTPFMTLASLLSFRFSFQNAIIFS